MSKRSCDRKDQLGVQSSDSGLSYVGILRVRLQLGCCNVLPYKAHVTWLNAFLRDC